jgi:hypothetical protein
MDMELGQPYIKNGKLKTKAPSSATLVTQYTVGDDMIATIVPLVACGATLGIVYYMYKELQKTKETQYKMEQTLKHTNTQLSQLITQEKPPVELVDEPIGTVGVEMMGTVGSSMVTLPQSIEDVEDSDSDSDTEVVELVSR